MRTMLIPTVLLLIFCSFSRSNAAQNLVPGCHKIYKCFAPINCFVENDPESNGQEIREIDHVSKINDDCPALLRYHIFAKNWVQVSIESFDPTTKSILFKQKKIGGTDELPAISCTEKGNGYEGKYGDKVEDSITDEKTIIEQAKGKMQCTFVIESPKKSKAIFDFSAFTAQFIIQTSSKTMTTLEETGLGSKKPEYSCDLSSFQFNNENKAGKKFAKVMARPAEYYCNDAHFFEMEYKPKGSDRYYPVISITCEKNNDYTVKSTNGNDPITEQAVIDIRCAADVRFFCGHAIKNPDTLKPGEVNLHKEDAKKQPKTPAVLNCPDTHPYLFVDGKLILKHEFECRNYGGTEYWTVIEKYVDKKGETKSKPQRLTPTGPVAYCAEEIACYLKYKIPDSSVKKGTLDAENRPICFKEGVLQVGGKNIEGNVTCNRKSGDFHYTIGNVEQTVTPATKFECYYEAKPDESQNKKDRTILFVAGGAGIIICATLVAGAVIAAVVMSRKHIKKMNMKREKEAMELFKMDEMGYKHYAFTKAQRRAMKKEEAKLAGKELEEKKPDEPKSAPCVDSTFWNNLVMDFCCHTESMLTPDTPTVVPEDADKIAVFEKDLPELLSACRNRKYSSPMTIVDYRKPRSIPEVSTQMRDFEAIVTEIKEKLAKSEEDQ